MNRKKFEENWTEQYVPLLKYVYNHVYNKSDVEDIVQQTAVKAIVNVDTLRSSSKFKPWIFQIATNAIRDYYRKQKRTPNFLEIDMAREIEVNINNYNKNEFSYSELLMDLKVFGNSLPLKKRSLLILLIQEKMTLKDIAKVLDIGYSTARKWHNEIKSEYEKKYFNDENRSKSSFET